MKSALCMCGAQGRVDRLAQHMAKCKDVSPASRSVSHFVCYMSDVTFHLELIFCVSYALVAPKALINTNVQKP